MSPTSAAAPPAERAPASGLPVLLPPLGPRHVVEGVSGDYRCGHCGYGISFYRGGDLPACPMCHAVAWQLVRWRPFSLPHRQP